jgi:catechol 2,3-dioxygenase-like lactoylglutathione lyase family enzyme
VKRGIDHLVLCVSDLERAVALYRQLGFTTTPRAQHPWGTDNSLVQLSDCFLELLTVARPELIPTSSEQHFSFGAYNSDFLSRREGMSMLAFESRDAQADRDEFASRGLTPFEDFHFERSATLPDGTQARIAFTLAFATDPRMPEAAFFCCQQHAPQYFWKPQYQSHANGAVTIDEVVMVAEEPTALADFFRKIQERESVEEGGDRLTVRTPRGTITVLTPENARQCYSGAELLDFHRGPHFLGFVVRASDLDQVAGYLRSSGIPFESSANSIWVSPKDAFGVLVEFKGGETKSE